ncbi:MAG: hypothetical protein F6K30_28640 [Cyanothece sp. SIO2G6]|nr:hypothetical protein [Cyanothece sp. SIO2G6]
MFGGNKGGQTSAPRPKDAFFLEPDDAKTFGDIDYMRKSKTIERTFPRGKAQVSQISSSTYKKVSETAIPNSSSTTSSSASQPSYMSQSQKSSFQPSSFTPPTPSFNQSQPAVKRSDDSSIDMFRKMAKDIKKR